MGNGILKIGDELEIEINEIGRKGDGIVSRGDYNIIIPGVKLYKKFRIRISRIKRESAFAEVISELKDN